MTLRKSTTIRTTVILNDPENRAAIPKRCCPQLRSCGFYLNTHFILCSSSTSFMSLALFADGRTINEAPKKQKQI